MMIFHLVRHAQQDWNRETPDSEWPLTSLGQKQAEDVVQELAKLKPDSLWCSETQRAIQTIKPFAKFSGMEVNRHPDLGERKLTWPLPSLDQIKERYRRGWEDLDYSLPNGESNREGQIRFMGALNDIAEIESKKGSDRSLIICANGNVIALAEHAVRGSFGKTDVDYCEIRSLIFNSQGWHLLKKQA